MLPSHWSVFERLPKNANGKIDRSTLKEMFQRDATLAISELRHPAGDRYSEPRFFKAGD